MRRWPLIPSSRDQVYTSRKPLQPLSCGPLLLEALVDLLRVAQERGQWVAVAHEPECQRIAVRRRDGAIAAKQTVA